MEQLINIVWVFLAAVMVMLMQAGFAILEAGLTRQKNCNNVLMKNIMDFAIGSIIFFIIGFGLMFGDSIGGFIGSSGFFDPTKLNLPQFEALSPSVFIFFQTVFCATAATIVSGAMAERTKFISYCIYSFVISAVIYPIVGHWVWGGGWLSSLGFHDFAGSTVVHSIGGWCALMGAWMLGPRIGKYSKNGKSNAIPGHSLTLGALGIFILWMGWFGFNPGSSLTAMDVKLNSRIFITTNLAAAFAACTTMILTWIRYKKPDVSMTLNGVLAGLVAITAGCDLVTPLGAAIIGVISSFAMVFGIEFIDNKLKIDDPVGAIGVHCINGVLGTFLTGLFAHHGEMKGLFYGGGFKFVGIQLVGILAVAAWTLITSGILFKVIKSTVGLRVSREEEIRGLDLEEHGIESSYADFQNINVDI